MPDTLFDLAEIGRVLTDAGWDVYIRDEVSARRSDVAGVWQLYADQGGRLRLQITRDTQLPHSQRIEMKGRQYRVLHEAREIINIFTNMDRISDLPEILQTFSQLAVRT